MLAVDLGERRIGVAVCDESRLTVRPLGVIESIGAKRDAQALRRMTSDMDVELLVVGLPLDAQGEEGPKALAAREQGTDLARRMELPVDFADESRSTLVARQRLIEAGTKRSRRLVVDADAAAIILETWLAERGASG